MKKYYVIKLSYDHGYWNEEKQDFVGWLNATKYRKHPEFHEEDDGYLYPSVQLLKASSKKPVTVVDVYENMD